MTNGKMQNIQYYQTGKQYETICSKRADIDIE